MKGNNNAKKTTSTETGSRRLAGIATTNSSPLTAGDSSTSPLPPDPRPRRMPQTYSKPQLLYRRLPEAAFRHLIDAWFPQWVPTAESRFAPFFPAQMGHRLHIFGRHLIIEDINPGEGGSTHSLKIDLINLREKLVTMVGEKQVKLETTSAAARTSPAFLRLLGTRNELRKFADELFAIEIKKGKIELIGRTEAYKKFEIINTKESSLGVNTIYISATESQVVSDGIIWIDVHAKINDQPYITAHGLHRESIIRCIELLLRKAQNPMARYTRAELLGEAQGIDAHLTQRTFAEALKRAERRLGHPLLVAGRPIGPRGKVRRPA